MPSTKHAQRMVSGNSTIDRSQHNRLSGDFPVINRALVENLEMLGLWPALVRDAIKMTDRSAES